MAELTPQNNYPIPGQSEEPYYATMKAFFLAVDAADWALAENDNLVWSNGGFFAWDATSGVLTWSLPVYIRSKTTPYKVIIAGPPAPGGMVTLRDGEVAYFKLPRLLVGDAIATLQVGPITFIPGTRLHDIKILAVRDGTTVYFADGKSLKTGEVGEIFGGGLGTTIPPHEHQPALVIEPPFIGIGSLDLNIASFAPSVLKKVSLYRSGQLLASPADYSVSLSTGIVTLVTATVTATERFVALMETSPTGMSSGDHVHLAPRVIDPPPGTFQLDMLVTSLDTPALTKVDLFRNGAVLAEPADYSLDLTTGLVTLIDSSVLGERFVALREVQ